MFIVHNFFVCVVFSEQLLTFYQCVLILYVCFYSRSAHGCVFWVNVDAHFRVGLERGELVIPEHGDGGQPDVGHLSSAESMSFAEEVGGR